MIITKDFVMLNLPKTGSTFARKVIWEIYQPSVVTVKDRIKWKLFPSSRPVFELMLPNVRKSNSKKRDQHGIYDQIPEDHKNKELVSIIRDPFTAYISRFNYKYWSKGNYSDDKVVMSLFPNYPNIGLKEYIDFVNHITKQNFEKYGNQTYEQFGPLSIRFLQTFIRNHKVNIQNISRTISKEQILELLAPVTFLRNENLNSDLFNFLHKFDTPQIRLQQAIKIGKQNVSTQDDYSGYLNHEIVDRILELEWLIFELFPEYLPKNNPLFQNNNNNF